MPILSLEKKIQIVSFYIDFFENSKNKYSKIAAYAATKDIFISQQSVKKIILNYLKTG